MAAKMAVYKKILPETGKLQKIASTFLFYWFMNLEHPSDAINTSLRIWYI